VRSRFATRRLDIADAGMGLIHKDGRRRPTTRNRPIIPLYYLCFAGLRRLRVAQLSIAVAILVLAMIFIYAVERLWFNQRHARAATIALSGAASEIGGVVLILLPAAVLLILVVALACVCFAQSTIFGQETAQTMQPSAFWQRIWMALDLSARNK
jgi:uncharacterized membrane protein